MRLIIHFDVGTEVRKVNLREKIVLVVKKMTINHYKNLSPTWIFVNLPPTEGFSTKFIY